MTISISTTNKINVPTRVHAHTPFCLSFVSGLTVPPVLLHRAEELDAHLDVLLQLELMLAGQLLVLPLELGDEELSLQLLLVLESQQLLLQLLLLVVCKRFKESL